MMCSAKKSCCLRAYVSGWVTLALSPMLENTVSATDLLARPAVGGPAGVVLGSDAGAWATSSQTHDGKADSCSAPALTARPPPGGADSVIMGGPQESPRAETLLGRPFPGGAASVVLGGDEASWNSGSNAYGTGCSDAAATSERPATAHTAAAAADSIDFTKVPGQTPSKPMRSMCATEGAKGTVVLQDIAWSPEPGVSSNRFASGSNQNSGNVITDRSSTRVAQAAGGTTSIDISDFSANKAGKAGTSANKFACGSNQNQGNVITDRSTTRLHQAPGGNSSINLSDNSYSHPVGVSGSPFARCSPSPSQSPNDRSSTKVRHAPGGASSLSLADGHEKDTKASFHQFTDENVNNANKPIEPAGKHPISFLTDARQAPGGDASIVLG